MNKLLVICGPTAMGKTQLGIKLAKKFNGEIVSADSRQVYRGMDIGTGKDLPVNSKFQASNLKQIKNEKFKTGYYMFDGIPVWMLDVVEPNTSFSVAQYSEIVSYVLKDIWTRKKLPIVVGGTGLYIKAIVDGIKTLNIPPNEGLRKEYENKTSDELFAILHGMNSELAASLSPSDRKNRRRLMRKIELVNYYKFREEKNILIYYRTSAGVVRNVLFVGLTAPSGTLKRRINKRIDEWIMNGAENEVKALIASGVSWEAQAMNAIGYREWKSYLEGKVEREKVKVEWKKNEWQYAKRQMTWFKKDKRINWFDVTEKSWQGKVESRVRKWYTLEVRS